MGWDARPWTIGLETLDLAKIHEQALVALMSPSRSLRSQRRDDQTVRRLFSSRPSTPDREDSSDAAMEANVRLGQLNKNARSKAGELAATNRQLKKEILQRGAVEKALKESEQHYSLLLKQSHHMEEQLRRLSRQILLRPRRKSEGG